MGGSGGGLGGGWELLAPERGEMSLQSAGMLYLHAVGASDQLVRAYLFRPLEGLVLSLDRRRLRMRHLGGTMKGFPPEDIDLDGAFNVTYNDAGRQWTRLVNYDSARQEVDLERVGPRGTFPMVRETLVREMLDNGSEMLVRTTVVTSFLGLEIYRGVQRLGRMSEVQLHHRRQSLAAAMTPDRIEGSVKDLGCDVLILGVHNSDARGDSGGACQLALFSCGGTFQEYVIGVAGVAEQQPFVVHRRYREFRALHEFVSTVERVSEFPPKTMFQPAGEVLSERRRKLQQFLSRVVEISVPPNSEAARAKRNFFLGTIPSPSQTHGKEAAKAPARSDSRRASVTLAAVQAGSSDPLKESLEHQQLLRAQSVRRKTAPVLPPRDPLRIPKGTPMEELFEMDDLEEEEVHRRSKSVRALEAKGGFRDDDVLTRPIPRPHLASDEEFLTPRTSERHTLPEPRDSNSSGSFVMEARSRSGSGDSSTEIGGSLSGRESPVSEASSRAPLSLAARLLHRTSDSEGEEKADESADYDLGAWLAPGVLVTKHSSKGQPNQRVLYFSEAKKAIFWTKSGDKPRAAKGKTIVLRDVRNVHVLSPMDGSPMRRSMKCRKEVMEMEMHFPFARVVRIETLRRNWEFEMDSAETAQKLVRGVQALQRHRGIA